MVLTFLTPSTPETALWGERLYLRPPRRRDWRQWAELRALSRDFLTPWEPTWAGDALSRASYRRRLQRYAEEWERDEGYAFFLFRKDDDQLLGGITLGNVRRGVAQCGSYGYWMGVPFAGQGYMTEAVRLGLRFAFGTLGLHRVEAACLVHNESSRRVLEKAGFSREGLARGYLKIDGAWQDHLLFAILREDLRDRL
ncbi:GNAT family N-acetyltransferase [Oceanibaculum indicum]|uniref:Ribosomal-protein-alanine acetyltransferase n=1 Tax=Oceanibaculum indicum P24 TaxID=1207063 RepID=K2IH16_9PROT|nr:GNAT family protein [Oceanibaculum indicum]EKE69406.1 ribosomal-protein-alanine acetyltransferase [Oceanibaculum indicum P24]